MWIGPGSEGKGGGGEENIQRRRSQRKAREAGAGRTESWVKGVGKMWEGRNGATEGEGEENERDIEGAKRGRGQGMEK